MLQLSNIFIRNLLQRSMEICSVKLFVNLGFAIHPEKWVFTSFQEIEFLGFINNLAVIKIKLTTEKKRKIFDICQKVLVKGFISFRLVL